MTQRRSLVVMTVMTVVAILSAIAAIIFCIITTVQIINYGNTIRADINREIDTEFSKIHKTIESSIDDNSHNNFRRLK